jgi:hypothetical protein
MDSCVEVGKHQYLPNERDTIAILTDNVWEPYGGGSDSFPTEWRFTRLATLTIDPTNYWKNMDQADCKCGNVAGFRLSIDGRTGEVPSARAGINCTVC